MLNLEEYVGGKYKVTKERAEVESFIIRGRRGEITAYDDKLIEVVVFGKAIRIPKDTLPDKTHNLSLPMKLEKEGWPVRNHYDDSTAFLIEKKRIFEALKVIKAKKKRVVTEEMRQRGRELYARLHPTKEIPDKTGGLEGQTPATLAS